MKSEQQVTRETILCGSKKDAERMVEVIKSRVHWLDLNYEIEPYEDRFYLHVKYIWRASTEFDRIQTLEKENAELRSVLLHLWQWLPLNYRRFYGSDYSPAKAIIERLQEQNDD